MPTTRRRRARQLRPTVSPTVWALLNDEPIPPDGNPFEVHILGVHNEGLREPWETYGGEIVERWVAEYPGTRPTSWWRFDAPRWRPDDPRESDAYYVRDELLPQPRLRLGGTGTPKYEVLANVPDFEFGIPASFVETWEVEYYNGRARDIHGNPIGTEFSEGDFDGIAYDPEDPPMFESQAAYLDRHRLLTADERKALAQDAFDPEPVIFDTGD